MKYLNVFLILILAGCGFEGSTPYTDDLKKLDQELTNHFPKSSKGLLSLTSFVTDTNSIINHNGNYLIAAFKYEIINDFLKKNETELSQYKIKDSCQIILSRDKADSFTDSCFCSSIPIPIFIVQLDKFNLLGDNFDLENAKLDDLRLPKDFEYYIKAESGIFLDKKLLFRDTKMPDCWAHGYSKGYAISKKRNLAIIWIDLW
nr:hypothetical protein [uncultured Draconibacterium sp.]